MDNTVLAIVFLAATTMVLLVLGAQKLLTQKKEKLKERVAVVAAKEDTLTTAAKTDKQGPAWLNVGAVVSRLVGPDFMRRQAELLASANLAWRASEFLTIRLTVAAFGTVTGLMLTERTLLIVLMAAAGFWLPVLYVGRRKAKRQSDFDMQLPDALQLIVNSLRAGFSFNKAMEVAAQATTPPISSDFGGVLREVSLGMTIEDALQGMARRAQSPEFDIVVSAYFIQREVGGNLAVIMEKVADTVRQRLRMRGELNVLTAQGRISGYVVGILPIAVFGIVIVAAPDYLDPLIKTTMGRGMLIFAVFWQLLGVMMIKSITNIKM
ncbi:MAG: type II secretion system F family protein [Verrucomicrobia bacterium]|nr:type II secretion system F family protein [Verrucomicrobiota bacterium]